MFVVEQCVKPGITLNQVNNTAEILLADELESEFSPAMIP
jgi:hypothetical protein